MSFASAYPIIRAAADAFRPPQRVRVSEGARIMKVHQSKGNALPWDPERTPYMIEPMDLLASRRHEAVVFAGPARTGKTVGLLDGWLAHCIVHDPGDFLVVHMTQDKAREYSKTRVDRMIRHSPEIRARMSARGYDDNTHDKMTRQGMWIRIAWPSASQLSASDYRYTAGTDYDRWADNIDGEGAGFGLLRKRTQTFLSRGMTMIESSPGREYDDPNWDAKTPHEAPPASGILGVYNTGDRRRWYWQCPDCSEHFEAAPGLRLFATLPDEDDLLEEVRSANLTTLAAHHALVCCPHCGSQIEQRWKRHLNDIRRAHWLADGQSITKDGERMGAAPDSNIASYWLGGVAAAYQRWESILLRYLQGLREYALSGSDLTLKTTMNTDQAMPYLPRALKEGAGDRVGSHTVDLPRYHAPAWTRFLIASVDVQAGRRAGFVVQVHAVGVDLEQAIVDRYHLTESQAEGRLIDPAGYPEDWDLLTDKVLNATYKIEGGNELRVLAAGVDTGGEAGVSTQAYAWFQRLRKAGLSQRAYLLKGASVKRRQPVVSAKARDPRGRPIPGVFLHEVDTNLFKDQVAASLRRTTPGPAYMHLPDWLPAAFFDELKAEIRGKDGKWKKIRESMANEALDLWVYVLAVCHVLGPANAQKPFNWHSPPAWALPIDAGNSQVMTKDERREMKAAPRPARKRSSGLGRDDWAL